MCVCERGTISFRLMRMMNDDNFGAVCGAYMSRMFCSSDNETDAKILKKCVDEKWSEMLE